MMNIFPIPAFHDNYIWIIVNGKRATAIDPGDSQPVMRFLSANQLTLEDILITHHHKDHTGGIDKLVKATQATVYAPLETPVKHCDYRVSHGERFRLDSLSLKFDVIATPGHTLDHICYYTPGHLFCGDTLFVGGCGRVFEGHPAMMYRSLQKIAALPADTKIYCAHEYTLANYRFAQQIEPNNLALQQQMALAKTARAKQEPTIPSTLEVELATNPFLRCEQETVITAATQRVGKTLSDGPAVFAVIREWKNQG